MRVAVVTDRLDNRGNPTNGVRVWKAFERLGHTGRVLGHGQLWAGALEPFDLILACGTILYPENLHQVELIARTKRPETTFALWYFDACHPAWPHSAAKAAALRAVVKYLDWLVMTDHSYPWESEARNFMRLNQGIDPDDFTGEPAWAGPRFSDVIFTGGFKGPHEARGGLLAKVADRFSLAVFGRNSLARVHGADFFAAYQLARVALVPAPPPPTDREYWSNRIYLAAATGTPCVVGYVPGIEDHYEPGREILAYRTDEECLEAIASLVADPWRREEMGRAARERTLREHTYINRVQTLLEALR